MPASPDDLFALLADLGMTTETHHHEAVFTVAESAGVKAAIAGGHTKNLFVKDKGGRHFLIVAEGEAQIPVNRISPLIGARGRLSFANADALRAHLGVEPGSVTAFAPMNDEAGAVTVVIDQALLAHERINCHPLTNTMTTTISRDDLLRFLRHVGHEPMVAPLSALPETALPPD